MAKYQPFGKINLEKRSWPDNVITKPPIWCSVDLRDGNQALPVPMSVEQKLAYFDLLLKIGFKQIEIGFPSANDTEYSFVRRLIDENLIPQDVAVQVLCQARKPLIRQTFAAVNGAPHVIFHLYNAVSEVQRKFTFGMSKKELVDLACNGVRLIKDNLYYVGEKTKIQLEYSPEDFSATDGDFCVEICHRVYEEWNPTAENPLILNLPATVETATANIFADQVEYFITHFEDAAGIHERLPDGRICGGKVIISLHNHNDRGTGVACAELGLLAGASRIEGTLFGNGERTGNLDIITVAMNMYTQGINPGLDFSRINDVCVQFTNLTGMAVPVRQPYGGALVFTSFSGSHQDAIRKALAARAKCGGDDEPWRIPYLPIDPKDVGREYEEIIRINAQSGKSGAAWILENRFGVILPKEMQIIVGKAVKQAADTAQKELLPQEVYKLFAEGWLNTAEPLSVLDIAETHMDGGDSSDNVLCRTSILWNGKQYSVGGKGNGPVAAFSKALAFTPVPPFSVADFHEHSIGSGSDTDAMAYVKLRFENGDVQWGAGRSSNIGRAGINAIVSAINRLSCSNS